MSERAWARRAALVLARPRQVFEALRDDSDETAGERQDVVVVLVFVGGVAAALATAGTGALDDLDALEILVWIFASGFALAAWLVFSPLLIPLAVWSLALLVLGLVVVQRWSYGRASAAVVLAVVWLASLAVGVWGVLALLGGGFE